MMLPRFRRDPLQPEKGGPKRARAAVRRTLEGDDVTIHIRKVDDGDRTMDKYVAWVEQCGEDEFGMLSVGDTPEHALWRLGADFQRVVHKARHPEYGV